MSHRAAILAYLTQAGLSTPHANDHINLLLQEHAHELAEQQRDWADSLGTTPTQQAITSVIREAADLIDPATTQEPPR
ncbi:hypothetical protein ACFU67_13135 [Streptomyces rhizosphaericola]|uniref:hypothetical protein n=1 Tax=Streptomyces rhizosphaericola TaxID=2564098 RepID=UPI0036AA5ECE